MWRALLDSIAQAGFLSHTTMVAHNHAHRIRILPPEVSLYLTVLALLDTPDRLEEIVHYAPQDRTVQAEMSFMNALTMHGLGSGQLR